MIPGGQAVVDELWVLLVVVLIVYLMRIASRRILLNSFKKFRVDDYLMTFAICLYIIVIVAIYLQCLWGNNYVTPEDVIDWTPQDFHIAIEGSKMGIAMECCKVTCVWVCKACLLILYASMAKGLPKHRRAVFYVAGYVAIGYVVVIICLFFVWCRPFHVYYDTIPVPDAQSECMTYRHHMLLDAAFNITSDAIMLCLPIPLVIRAKVPLARKLVLVGVFGLGGIVILCAILNRITNFTAPYGSLVYLNWYAGETATAVIVANVPHLWPLISRVFNLGTFKRTTSSPSRSNQYPLKSTRSGTKEFSSHRATKHDIHGYIPTDSDEQIAIRGDKDANWGYSKKELDRSESGTGDLELGNNYTTTSVRGGGLPSVDKAPIVTTKPVDEEFHKSGQIVKTVHINQYGSDA